MLAALAPRAVLWLAVALLVVPAAAAALEPSDFPLLGDAPPPILVADVGPGGVAQAPPPPADAPGDPPAAAPAEPTAVTPNHLLGALVAAASVTGSALARRLGWSIGPLKYLNLSFTYGTKGYPKGAIETRERQVGVEIGLNFQEILDDVGVRRDRWWGYVAHMVFDNVRFPFTAGGFRYDLNHKKWHELDSGNSFGF